MSKSDKIFLTHILQETGFILASSKNIEKETFLHDEVMKRAITRSIEIIGEAIKNISDAIKIQYPDVEWRKIAGARDRLIHGYFSIDYDIIWDIIINKIPVLDVQIQHIITNNYT